MCKWLTTAAATSHTVCGMVMWSVGYWMELAVQSPEMPPNVQSMALRHAPSDKNKCIKWVISEKMEIYIII